MERLSKEKYEPLTNMELNQINGGKWVVAEAYEVEIDGNCCSLVLMEKRGIFGKVKDQEYCYDC